MSRSEQEWAVGSLTGQEDELGDETESHPARLAVGDQVQSESGATKLPEHLPILSVACNKSSHTRSTTYNTLSGTWITYVHTYVRFTYIIWYIHINYE